MTELEKIKDELTLLTGRVNDAIALTNGSIYLTHEQIKELMNIIRLQTIEDVNKLIDDVNLDIEDKVDLELSSYSREIEVSVNEDEIKETIKEVIEKDMNDILDDDVINILSQLKPKINI
jgi:hypothetical protein